MSAPTLLEVQRWMTSRIRAGAIPLPDDIRAPALHPQGGQAGAAAQATIRVVLPGVDGDDEVVDVPRTNVRRLPEAQEGGIP